MAIERLTNSTALGRQHVYKITHEGQSIIIGAKALMELRDEIDSLEQPPDTLSTSDTPEGIARWEWLERRGERW